MIKLKRKHKYQIDADNLTNIQWMLFIRRTLKSRHFKQRKYKWPSSTKARTAQYSSNNECHSFIRLPGIPIKSLRQRSTEARAFHCTR